MLQRLSVLLLLLLHLPIKQQTIRGSDQLLVEISEDIFGSWLANDVRVAT